MRKIRASIDPDPHLLTRFPLLISHSLSLAQFCCFNSTFTDNGYKMALADARAVLHRTANRCLVQEDAKRAPKLACCSSIPTSAKQADTVSSASRDQFFPTGVSLPYNLNPSFHSLSPNSKWWLYLQPNHGYQEGFIDEQFSSPENRMEICQKHEHFGALAKNNSNPGLVDQTTSKNTFCDNQGTNIATGNKLGFRVKGDGLRPLSSWKCQDPSKQEDVKELTVQDLGLEVPKSANEICFDPKSWIGAEKNAPWWRTADIDELASLVAQRSFDYIENCDLPMPQNTHAKKDVDVKICCFGSDEISSSLPDQKHDAEGHNHCSSRFHTAGSPTCGSAFQKLSVLAEGESASNIEKPLSDIPTHETMVENGASKAQLMEALCHSQTRAREAERAAKQACEEKEHVVKLIFGQASQLFAYKQWLHLLQLKSVYLQFLNNSSQSVALLPMLPWTPQRTNKAQTRINTFSTRKRAKNCSPRCEASTYAVVFTIGLGLAGAGFLLGWSMAWMFPSW